MYIRICGGKSFYIYILSTHMYTRNKMKIVIFVQIIIPNQENIFIFILI